MKWCKRMNNKDIMLAGSAYSLHAVALLQFLETISIDPGSSIGFLSQIRLSVGCKSWSAKSSIFRFGFPSPQ
jgi:hypothetical protein